jgi:NhaP-type Na+/H+ or K+/H+ antiporter
MTKEQLLRSHAKNYTLLAGLFVFTWILSQYAQSFFYEMIPHHTGSAALLITFFELILITVLGFFAYELAKPTVLPSFVVAIGLGMIARNDMAILVDRPDVLTVLTTLGATFILFGGGLDTPFVHFKKLVSPILAIAFLGTLITASLFTSVFTAVSSAFDFPTSFGAAVLLGSALASTDPAAIIPSLKSLVFLRPRVKHIAVSESAINDVVGTVLTGVFLTIFSGTFAGSSIANVYGKLLTPETGLMVIHELFIGCAVGIAGFLILHLWSKWKASTAAGGDADSALFLAIPLFCYTVAVLLEGSGFLAVFIAGLLFQLEEHMAHVEHYFNHTIEGFMKPLIFLLLGATVNPSTLLATAPLGIAVGLLFMFVIRPVAVFMTLFPFMHGRHGMTFSELLFLSFVRETGVIPAVLLISLGSSGIPGTADIVPIGLWVILLTLIIQPPLTPYVAKKLGIAADPASFPHIHQDGPMAILCSRGLSFQERLPLVIAWAEEHKVKHVLLLHCPEERFQTEFVVDVQNRILSLVKKIEAEQRKQKKPSLHISYLIRPGLLQDNIESLLQTHSASIIFVGAKMLDYRMEDVKRLKVPFVFME